MIDLDGIRKVAESSKKETGGELITGGCSGRMITTPDGYVGDGFIADVDIKINANFIATCNPTTVLALLDHIDKLTKCLLAAEHTLTTTHNLYATDRPDLINTPLASLIFWTTDNSEVLEWISTVLKEATTNETTT